MELTPQAKKRWESIPQQIQVKLLNNVWCTQCKEMVGIGNVRGKMDGKDLILEGICATCASPVARVIEAE